MDSGEHGERHKENEEDVEQLWGGLLEDLPVRNSATGVLLRRSNGSRLLLQQFMVAVEFLHEDRTGQDRIII